MPGDLTWFSPQGLSVLDRARALGLPTSRYGMDEGRLLFGPEGPTFALTTRAVGPAYQGSWDALMFKLLAATGVDEAYYSRWGLGFSPDIFADPSENADSVATNVAQLAFALADLPSVPTTNTTAIESSPLDPSSSSSSNSSSIVDGVVGLDGGVRVVALLFHHHPWLNASESGSGVTSASVNVQLCGAPGGSVGKAVTNATSMRVGAGSANAWPAWSAAAAAANLSFTSGDYRSGWSAWSDSPPLASTRAQATLIGVMPALQAAAALVREPLAGGAAVGTDACLRFQVTLQPHEVALVEIVLPMS